MKREITITIAGEAMVGKSLIALMTELALTAYGVEVKNEDDARPNIDAGAVTSLSQRSTVTIRTRLLPKPAEHSMVPSGDTALLDATLFGKVKTARDLLNGIDVPIRGTIERDKNRTLALLDEVADELEDRLAAESDGLSDADIVVMLRSAHDAMKGLDVSVGEVSVASVIDGAAIALEKRLAKGAADAKGN